MGAAVGFAELCELAGGVVLFLYGLHLASEKLKLVAGSRLKVIIRLLTGNRMLGLVAGLLGTVLVQSNTATAVILVGMCQAGVINMARSIGVLLGANLGSTVTVQFIAFDLYAYALLLIAVGFLANLDLDARKARAGAIVSLVAGLLLWNSGLAGAATLFSLTGIALLALSFLDERQAAGLAMMGFGLIFVGLKIIKTAMAVIKEDPAFVQLLLSSQNYPLLVVAVAFVFTVLTNSSTATLGTAIALVSAGGGASSGQPLLGAEGAVCVVMGAHLGSCPMAMLSSAGQGRIARQVSYAHVLVKVAGVALVYPLLGPFTSALKGLNVAMGASAARSVANAHSLFNLVNVVSLLPFTPQVAKLLERLIPPAVQEDPGILKHISREHMEYHPMAMDSAELEVKRLAFMIRDLLRRLPEGLRATQLTQLEIFEKLDDEVDQLFRSILAFLTRLGQERLGHDLFQRQMTLVYVLTHLEGMGDRISKDFQRVQRKRILGDGSFSIEGQRLLGQLHELLLKRVDAIIVAFGERDSTALRTILNGQDEFLARSRLLTKAHFKQLVRGISSAEDTSMHYLDTLSVFMNIHRGIVDIAQNLMYCPYYTGDRCELGPDEEREVESS